MKVAVCLGRTPASGGGAFTFEESVAASFLSSEKRIGHEIVLVGGSGRMMDEAARLGHAVLAIPERGGRRALLKIPRVSLGASRDRRRVVARNGIDARIVSTGCDFLLALGPEVPSTEIPFGLVVWDIQHRRQPFFPEVSRDGIWDRREEYYADVLRKATFVITGTSVGRDEVAHFYGIALERIAILPHPTPQFALNALEHDPGVPLPGALRDESYVMYPAQFWPHKNHVTLFEALKILKNQGLTMKLALVGSDWGGNKEHVLRMAERIGVRDLIVDLGFVERDVLVALYRGAVALAYPSLFGPENLPPLEAFALGCPVIAADVPGAEEQLGNAALLGAGTDPAFFASAIERMMNDPQERQTLIARGSGRARRSTPDSFADGLFDLLDAFEPIRRNWPSGG